MRVELIYTPGCSNYKKALSRLETIIAEERLPLHVEMVEALRSAGNSPTIRIDGNEVGELPASPQGEFCRLYTTSQGLSAVPGIDFLRELIWRRWKDLTEAPLKGS